MEPTAAAAVDDRRVKTVQRATWVRNVGAILLLFVAYQLWGTNFEQARTQAHLKKVFDAAPPTGAAAPVPAPLPGGVVARIEIPTIGVDQYVVAGTTADQLRRGPGLYDGSPMPGEAGNVAIAGHRTTYGAPFNRLDELKVGDKIVTTTAGRGAVTYIVFKAPFPISPHNVDIVNDFGDDRLTLTTCNPKFSAAQRLVVWARPEKKPPPRPHTRAKPVRVKDSTSWHFGTLPLAAIWLVALLGLARAYQPIRRQWPALATVLLLAPLWAAGLLLFFEQLNRLLPPNV